MRWEIVTSSGSTYHLDDEARTIARVSGAKVDIGAVERIAFAGPLAGRIQRLRGLQHLAGGVF